MRLGEILQQQGLVSADDVDQAARSQRGLGGRIGTNLIEAGSIDGDQVALALAQQKGVPAARLKHFETAGDNLRRIIPKYVVERHNAIPIAVATRFGRELVVAFMDPDDIASVEAIAEAAGMRIRPAVAPEFYIIHYLDKLYGVPARRFLRTVPDLSLAEPQRAPHSYPRSLTEELGTLEPIMADRKRQLQEEVDEGWDLDPAPAPPPAADVAATAEQPTMLTAEHAIERMKSAESKDDIGEAVAGYLVNAFGGGVVFVVKKEAAVGWQGFAPGGNAAIEALSLPLDQPSALRDAMDRRAPVKTAPEDAAFYAPLWQALGASAPQEILVTPIAIRDRVVNLVYAHAANGAALADDAMSTLVRVCAAASAAYVELIQRKKK